MGEIPSVFNSQFKETADNFIKAQKIKALRNKIAETDYVFIKLKEYEEVGLPQPYTDERIAQLHAERQAMRDEINELQQS